MLLVACNRSTELPVTPPDAAPSLERDAASADASIDVSPLLDLAADTADVPSRLEAALPMEAGPPDTAAAASDGPDCGRLDFGCCPDLSCRDPETVCVGADPTTATCKRCGRVEGVNQNPCCAGNQCLDGSCCIHIQSGNVGPFCVRPGTVCWDVNSRCSATGSCGAGCGGAGQACCQGLGVSYCSATGTACMRIPDDAVPSCIRCGKADQPCCRHIASPYSIEPCERGLRCRVSPAGDRCSQ